jgi:uncharacterized membrane protein YgcG
MQQPHRRPLRPAIVVAAVATFAATGAVGAGCGRNDSDQYVNCVDENGIVVDPDYCDDDDHHGGYYYYPSRTRHRVGAHAPSNWRSSSVDPKDSAARSRAGLPTSGHVGGTKVRSGGFGGGNTSSGGKSGGS